MRRFVSLAGVLAAVCIVLAACNGSDPSPVTSSTTSSASSTSSNTTSPSATTSSTTTMSGEWPPGTPTAAKAHTGAGAAAYVKFYLGQAAKSWETPTDDLIPGLGLPTCTSCNSLQQTAKELVAKDHRYSSSVFTFSSVVYLGRDGADFVVDVRGTQNRAHVVDGSGRVVSTDEKAKIHNETTTRWVKGRWFVVDGKAVVGS